MPAVANDLLMSRNTTLCLLCMKLIFALQLKCATQPLLTGVTAARFMIKTIR